MHQLVFQIKTSSLASYKICNTATVCRMIKCGEPRWICEKQRGVKNTGALGSTNLDDIQGTDTTVLNAGIRPSTDINQETASL